MRRVFRAIVIVALLGTVVVGAFYLWLQPRTKPRELLFVNGEIVTMAHPPVVGAMWIRDGRIVALGAELALRATARGAREVNLKGATLMPGLIEPHTHPLATALLRTAIDVSGFTHDSRESAMQALREGATGFVPWPWIVAYGWDPVMVPGLSRPTLAELDSISRDKPLLVLTQMAHEAYVNSAALRAAGVTRDTPDPPGGSFGRDDRGELDGGIHEVNAISRILEAMPPAPVAVASLILRWQYAAYADAGFTTIGVLGPVGRVDDPIGIMRVLSQSPRVPVRTVVYALPGQLDPAQRPSASDNGRFAICGVKFWMDGSPYAGGAALDEPYEDSELVLEELGLPSGHRGALNYDVGGFREEFARFHKAGYQVAVHAQGERAVRTVLDAAEPVLAAYPRDGHRHRLEHNALITVEQIARARELGFELSFFIDHIYYYGDRLPALIGTRVARYMPLGTALRHGHRATIHTDSPAAPIGPFRAMRTAMLRVPRRGGEPLGLEERISVEEALRTMTTHAARQLGMENEVGSLEVGKLADFVVLSQNPLKTPTEAFDEIEVVQTWVEGQPVDTRRSSWPNLQLAVRAAQELSRQ